MNPVSNKSFTSDTGCEIFFVFPDTEMNSQVEDRSNLILVCINPLDASVYSFMVTEEGETQIEYSNKIEMPGMKLISYGVDKDERSFFIILGYTTVNPSEIFTQALNEVHFFRVQNEMIWTTAL